MKEVLIPKYVFRGTTLNYPGGRNSQLIPYTCTTRNPAKAVLFALLCNKYSIDPVVYVADTVKLKVFNLHEPNVLAEFEEEFSWKLKPLEFCGVAEGYLTVRELQNALLEIGIDTQILVRIDNLSNACN